MTNSELINAYLDNDLNEADRLRFEERLSRDPDLKEELGLHEDIIEGIRNARKEQLKHRLDQVDVGGKPGWSTAKIIGTMAIVAAGITAVYFLYPDRDTGSPQPLNEEIADTETDNPEKFAENEQIVTEETEPAEEITVPADTDEENTTTETPVEDVQDSDNTEIERQPEVKRPVVAPSFDNDDTERTEVIAPDGAVLGKVVIGDSRVDVEVIRNIPNRNFHYAFDNNTLKLYGDFDNELYEVLEFNSNKGKRWFLNYMGKYYSLDASANGIIPLKEIKDNKLLDVLNDIH